MLFEKMKNNTNNYLIFVLITNILALIKGYQLTVVRLQNA